MKNMLAIPAALLLLHCGYVPREVPAPATFTEAEAVPERPSTPFEAVVWMLNYDVGQFDSVWDWLQTQPASPERSRAMAVASLIAVAELDRPYLFAESGR